MNDMMESIIHHTLSEIKSTSEQIKFNEEKLSREELQMIFKTFEASEARCFNCGGFSDSFTLTLKGKYGGETRLVCETCATMYMSHQMYFNFRAPEQREIETEQKKIIRLKGLKIYNLRKHQRSIKALLTLLNGLSKHRLPHDLIRTLKGYLY